MAGFVGSTAIAYVYCLVITGLIAAPIYRLFRRFNLVRSWTLVPAGAAIRWMTTMVLLPQSMHKQIDWLVFWLIARGGTQYN